MQSVILFSLLLVHTLVSYEQSYEIFKEHPGFSEFLEYLLKYGLELEYGEMHHRFAIFLSNQVYIQGRNNQGLNFTLGMNAFGHLTNGEYRELIRSSLLKQTSKGKKLFSNSGDNQIGDIDYRERGVVSRVKNQGQCGSCWAFSATGCLESQLRLQGLGEVDLSEQQLVDCSSEEGNQGCNGGLMDSAFEYTKKHGIMSESAYSYTGTEGTCRGSETAAVIYVDEIFDIPSKNERELALAIMEKGPVSVAIDAGNLDFQFYSSGVYDNEKCSTEELNHGVLTVGLGSHPIDYYIVKNSWGNLWGDNGYIKIARNRNNMCGIATAASFATVKTTKD